MKNSVLDMDGGGENVGEFDIQNSGSRYFGVGALPGFKAFRQR